MNSDADATVENNSSIGLKQKIGEIITPYFCKKLKTMLLWQVCSIFLCALATICTILTENVGGTLPFLQLFGSYFSLLIFHVWSKPTSNESWVGYLVVSLCNLGGDVASIYAYTMTSLSTAQLLVTTVVFWVAPLSFLFFRRTLSIVQFLSILLGIVGIILVFVEDGAGNSKWTGNLIALASSLCYAFATTMEEKLVHEGDIKVYLFRFAICTTPISVILTLSVELKPIENYTWNALSISLVIAYGLIMAIYYTMVPYIMKNSTATEMNLSFLTSNFFSLFISCIFFGQKMTLLYGLGFLCVPVAITLFCIFQPNTNYCTKSKKLESVDQESHEPTSSIVDSENIYTQ